MRISNNQKLNFRALKSINYERNFNPNRNNECNYLLRDFRDSEAIKEYCNKNDVNAYIGFSQDNRETRAWVDLTSKGKIISIFTYTDNNSKKTKGVSPAQRVLVSLGNYIKNYLTCSTLEEFDSKTYDCIPAGRLSDEKCRKMIKERTPLKHEISREEIFEKFA